MADRLGVPVQRLKKETSLTEFRDWKEYLRWQANEHTVDRHYLAQIACEIRRSCAKKPNDVKLNQFLLEFKTLYSNEKPPQQKPDNTDQPKELNQDEINRRTAQSMMYWNAFFKQSEKRPNKKGMKKKNV